MTNSPYGETLAKFKFVYIAFCLADTILRKKKPANNLVLTIMCIFLFYTIVWGYVLDNSHVAAWNALHRRVMIMYIPMLFGTVFELLAYDCYDEYLASSALAIILVLIIQVIGNFSEFSLNPLVTIHGMITENRLKSAFGFTHVNYAGNSCFAALMCYFVRPGKLSGYSIFHSKKKILILILEFLVWMILLSTTCRTALIALFLFLFSTALYRIYTAENLTKDSKILFTLLIISSLLLFLAGTFAIGFWDYVWSHSNRSLNVSENVKWVGVIGNKWTGMGYVDNQCYYRDDLNGGIGGFGVATSSLDMNYLFIYCSTGILGTILFVSLIVLTGIGIIRNIKQKNGIIYLFLYLDMVFYAYWETVMFTYRFWPMITLTSIMLCACNGEMKDEENKNCIAPPSHAYNRSFFLSQGNKSYSGEIKSADFQRYLR